MDDFIKTFHVDLKLIIAQLINFGLVVWVVWRFALKSILSTMQKRADEIDKSLAGAKKIESDLEALTVTRERILKEANSAAGVILDKAQAQAETERQATLARVRNEAEKVIIEAKEKLMIEQEAALQAVRKEAAKLITQGVLIVIGKLPSDVVDKSLVEEAVVELGKKVKK